MFVTIIIIVCAILLALYIFSGIFAPLFMVHGHSEDDFLKGHVLLQTPEGSLVRLENNSLCWLKDPVEEEKKVLVLYPTGLGKNPSDSDFDPENFFQIRRCVLDDNGRNALIIRLTVEKTFLCKLDNEYVLVEGTATEFFEALTHDQQGNLIFRVKADGYKILPLCTMV